MKLTKRAVDAAKPSERDLFHWCEEQPGFGLRVYPNGAKTYLFQWKRDGRTRRVVLGRHGPTTWEEARRKALAHAVALDRGEDPAADRDARKADLTIAELCDRWLAAGCPRAKPGRDGRAVLKAGSATIYRSAIERHIKPLLGGHKLGSLRSPDLARFQSDVAAGKTAVEQKTKPRGKARVRGGAGIAGRVTAYLAAILSWGVKQGLLAQTPATNLEIIPSGRRDRYLSANEIQRLGETLAAMEAEGANPSFVAASRLLALTGCRRNEILRLRWDEVEIESKCLRRAGCRAQPFLARGSKSCRPL